MNDLLLQTALQIYKLRRVPFFQFMSMTSHSDQPMLYLLCNVIIYSVYPPLTSGWVLQLIGSSAYPLYPDLKLIIIQTIHKTFLHFPYFFVSEIERKDRGAHMKNLVNHHKFLKNSVNLCSSKQVGNKADRSCKLYWASRAGEISLNLNSVYLQWRKHQQHTNVSTTSLSIYP